jgi:glycosyltransferase involved in cell wall biosynthesis
VYYAIGTYSGSRSRLQLRLWRHLVTRADAVLAEGEEVRHECIARLRVPPTKVTLAPNGRDPDEFHPRPGPTDVAEPLVLFVGALTEGKRPERFVEMIAGLRSQGRPARAALIGDGPRAEALIGPASSASVDLLGRRGDIADQMRLADILVFTSRSAGEGMPGVLIEAGLSGLPVVATAAPGVRSIVEHGETGLVVEVDDLPGLIAATGALLDDPERRTAMGRAGRRRCQERYSLGAVGDRWMSVIGPLMDSRHPGSGPTVGPN